MKIVLKRDAVCAECESVIPAGSQARWYRNGAVYGFECHPQKAPKKAAKKAAKRETRREVGPDVVVIRKKNAFANL